jgi:hypothetical protein
MDIGKKFDINDKEKVNGIIDDEKFTNKKIGWFSDCSTPTANEFIYLSQILAIFIVMLVSLYNLSTKSGDDSLWTALLTSCLGYMLPNPKIKIVKPNLQEANS